MEKLLSLEDIKNLSDGTLIRFFSEGSFYGDEKYGIINHVYGNQVIVFAEDCELMHVDETLLPCLKKEGIEFADGKVKVRLYKEI